MPVKKISFDARKTMEDTRRHAGAFAGTKKKKSRAFFGLVPYVQYDPDYSLDAWKVTGDRELWESSIIEPIDLASKNAFMGSKGTIWLFQNCLYQVTGTYTDEQVKLLILDAVDKERRTFERLRAEFDSEASKEVKQKRGRIPEEVRVAVWRRDQGRCARCGSRENLEYDHIVPLSKGGSNTVRNIELLCEKCNREEGNRVR